MEPYQNMKVWNTWIFEVCKISAFWILVGFFLVKRHNVYTHLEDPGMNGSWHFGAGGGEADFLGFFYCFLNVEARLKLQRVHVVGDVLELILMTQLSKEHSNWLVEHTCLTQKKLYTCSWFGNSFIFVFWGTLGMFQGSVGIFLEVKLPLVKLPWRSLRNPVLNFGKSRFQPAYG